MSDYTQVIPRMVISTHMDDLIARNWGGGSIKYDDATRSPRIISIKLNEACLSPASKDLR